MTQVYFYPLEKPVFKNAVFILGSFEAFHLGHQELLKIARKLTSEVVLMLIMNPQKLPKSQGKNFTDLAARVQMVANVGIKKILIIDFDQDLRQLSGKIFVEKLISYGGNFFVVGKNFVFGNNGDYNARKLQNFWPNTKIVDLLFDKNGNKFSTSQLKLLLEFGDFANLNQILVGNFLVSIKPNAQGQFSWNPDLILPPAGFYLGYFIEVEKDQKFPVILQIEFAKSTCQLHFFEQIVLKKGFLEIALQIRYVYTRQSDKLNNDDIEKAHIFFNNNKMEINN
ncbi:FAD synthase [Mycoplasma sp. 'Moose RK']|uniref:FAD synthase n=1 Tax=Mycoplasma sp. 'Moose RK' TaxID=2780095 RepID=UPI0018C273C7|nr:adenylyltransferase/cytidyltransferase family protein [Mycoplasma sp. 'Moose RK']MBG0730776.1 adenylyltransferase/cytidyltransferase family protein [Mycoplasma sp. 'Moose RK']